MRLHSSFNSDRIAACLENKKPAPRKERQPYYIAQYRDKEVFVLTSRGRRLYRKDFGSRIIIAQIQEGVMNVRTEDGSEFSFDAETGELLSSTLPVLLPVPEVVQFVSGAEQAA